MKETIDLVVLPKEAENNDFLKATILERYYNMKAPFTGFKIVKRSIDARSRNVKINLRIEVYFGEEISSNIPTFKFQQVKNKKHVVIIGAGPAGLFAALRLLELGIKPIIIERGKDVKERRRDLAAINKEGVVNPDSNYCFGEGGAGTYSDGKLYTRSTKRGDVNKILSLLVYHGAKEEIMVDAHPHIGTNKLPEIIVSIRETILSHGGEIHFQTRLKDILITDNTIKGILTESVEPFDRLRVTPTDGSVNEIQTDTVILATGHSARDIFELLDKKGILIEAKPFAMGVRVEHSQELIDSIQYHCFSKQETNNKRAYLPAAPYSLVQQVNDRGVYSFCMCPGGIIAPCATAEGEVVVNGWSPSKRDNPFANSGIVVSIELNDLKDFHPERIGTGQHGALAGLRYQQSLEQMAYKAGGGKQVVPAQRLEDFVNGKISPSLPATSYHPGIKSAPMHELLPAAIGKRLQEGFKAFGKKMTGYLTNEAVIHGVESRTSSPVRIPRDKETYEHTQLKGLYPVGEGAGYAGGIISAAIDGQVSAEMVAGRMGVEVR